MDKRVTQREKVLREFSEKAEKRWGLFFAINQLVVRINNTVSKEHNLNELIVAYRKRNREDLFFEFEEDCRAFLLKNKFNESQARLSIRQIRAAFRLLAKYY
jgi:hypothetical protein